MAFPVRSATMEPVKRLGHSPLNSSYPSNMECMIPVPRVSVRNSSRYPIRVRAGHAELQPDSPFPVVEEVQHLPFSKRELFRDHPEEPFLAVDQQPLDRLELHAVFGPDR